MKSRRGMTFLGLTIASGAALFASAGAASAGPGVYASTSTATAGSVNFGDGPDTSNTVIATDAHPSMGTSSSIYNKDLPNDLGSIETTPYVELETTHAQVYRNGISTACSADFSGACGQTPAPLVLKFNVANVLAVTNTAVGNWAPVDVIQGLPDPLKDYDIVVDLTGPSATCEAGPIGAPAKDFKSSEGVVDVSVDLQDKGKSLIGGSKTLSYNGDLLAPALKVLPFLNGIAVSQILQDKKLLGQLSDLTKLVSVSVAYTPGTEGGAGKGPATSAAAGALSVTVNNFRAANFVGGKVSCGPNQEVAAAAESAAGNTAAASQTASASEGAASASKTAPARVTYSSSEIPLTGFGVATSGR